ncbi:sugar transporter SWEET1-like [Antedon mediterranea]|uniref:sugar transporter SWEET1-like n=1 Tax=Antedon mediterranea TaxID=105859 RepID=UPI003AF9ABD1
MDRVHIVGLSATVSSIAFFLAGIPTCLKIRKQGSTKNIEIFPYIACSVSCIFWLKYGLLQHDVSVTRVNIIGVVFQWFYVLVFYLNTLEKSVVHQKFFYASCVVFPVLIYIKFMVRDHFSAVNRLGLICCTTSVITYGSPLASIKEVIRTKSTESMAFPLCLANFLVAVQWLYYGHLVMDIYLQVPNFFGSLLGLFQLMFFVIYPSRQHYDLSTPGTSI